MGLRANPYTASGRKAETARIRVGPGLCMLARHAEIAFASLHGQGHLDSAALQFMLELHCNPVSYNIQV